MDENVKLGRIFGVQVGLHWSWFLIFMIVTYSLAVGIFAAQLPGLPKGAYWGLATLTSLLLFASVLAHEFGHAVLSIRNHIPVRRITLFIFGGVAQIDQEPRTPGVEFRIAIAGPLVSLALALLFGGIAFLGQSFPYLQGPARWLAEVNFTLVLFNMVPGFPLDGGRVLRSMIWAVTGNYRRSTQVATYIGQFVALAFATYGAYSIIRGNFVNGLWVMFIAWFLNTAATAYRQQVENERALEDVRVTQVMDRRMAEVPRDLPLNELVQQKIIQGGHRSFLVSENQRLVGLVTIHDIIQVPRDEWTRTTVGQVMVPWARLVQVSPDAALASVLQSMEIAHLAHVPVVYNNRVEGLLTREQILHYIRTRAELGL